MNVKDIGSYIIQVDTTNAVVFDTKASGASGRGQLNVATDEKVIVNISALNNESGASSDITIEQSIDNQVSFKPVIPTAFTLGEKEMYYNEDTTKLVLEQDDAIKVTTTGDVYVRVTWMLVEFT